MENEKGEYVANYFLVRVGQYERHRKGILKKISVRCLVELLQQISFLNTTRETREVLDSWNERRVMYCRQQVATPLRLYASMAFTKC